LGNPWVGDLFLLVGQQYFLLWRKKGGINSIGGLIFGNLKSRKLRGLGKGAFLNFNGEINLGVF